MPRHLISDAHEWTPWTVACQTSLSITNSQHLLKLMPIESVMPFNRVTLCLPLLLLPSIFPCIRVFSIESFLPIRWPKYWSFSFSISPSNEYSGLKVKLLSRFRLFATPWTVAHQAPQSMEFSRQEYWSGLPFPSPGKLSSEKA